MLALLYFGVFPAVGSAVFTGLLLTEPEVVQSWQMAGVWTWVLPLALAIGLGLLPNTVAALAGGYLFGMAFAPAFVGTYAIALSIGYLIARIVPGSFLQDIINARPKWRRGLDNLKDEGVKTIILLRLSPIFPFGMTNLVLGWLGFGYGRTLTGSLVGMAPRGLLLVYLGSQAGNLYSALKDGKSAPMLGTALGLTALALWGLYSLWKKKKPLPPGTASYSE